MRILFLFLFFFCACSGEVPKDVLPPKKMEAVLYDVIRTDEWVDFARLRDSTFQKFSKRTALYNSVFRMHSIKKEDYRKSMSFYQSRPDLLKEMLASMKAQSDTALKKLSDTSKVKP
jgi:hypothetical protein